MSVLRRESRTFELEHCGQMPLLNNARTFCPSLIETVAKRVSILPIQISALGLRSIRCPVSSSLESCERVLVFWRAWSTTTLRKLKKISRSAALVNVAAAVAAATISSYRCRIRKRDHTPNLLSCNFALALNGDCFRREGRETIAIAGS